MRSINYKQKFLDMKEKVDLVKNDKVTKRVAVYIGRFQPLHIGHTKIIDKGLNEYDYLIVFIGSANISDNNKNPYSAFLRKEFVENYIKEKFSDDKKGKYSVIPLNNHPMNNIWKIQFENNIRNILASAKINNHELYLLGSEKDQETKSYLDYIVENTIVNKQDFTVSEKINELVLDATDIRKKIKNILTNENLRDAMKFNNAKNHLKEELNDKIHSSTLKLIINNAQNNMTNNKIQSVLKFVYQLRNDEKENIFQLYKTSYADVEKDTGLTIENAEDLFKNYVDISYFMLNDKIFGGIISSKRLTYENQFNKLSVIIHDGSKFAIKYVYDVLAKLLVSGGYFVEASGKVSDNLTSKYNLKPLNFERVREIFPNFALEKVNETDYKRSLKSKPTIDITKKLFGTPCVESSMIYSSSLGDKPLEGCNYRLNLKTKKESSDRTSNDHLFNLNQYNIFENIFEMKANMKFLSDTFIPYSDLNAESFLSNDISDHIVNLINIDDYKSYFMDINHFSFIDLLSIYEEDDFKNYLKSIEERIKINTQYVLDDNPSEQQEFKKPRIVIRDKLNIFIKKIRNDPSKKDLFIQMFGKDIYDNAGEHVFVDVVPRDTNINNESARFRAINLVHTDIYPNVDIGETVWSFRNTWTDKLKCIKSLENFDFNNYQQRDFWNENIIGIFNIWINLTDEITDNGFTVMNCKNFKKTDLIPYKAYRRGTTSAQNINFISSSVKYNENQQWCTKYKMEFGESLIFRTDLTPHTGFTYVNGSEKNRKSMECRIIFMKKNILPQQNTKLMNATETQPCQINIPSGLFDGDNVVVSI
jgi:cytidyltransferase-like protein